MWHTRTCLCPAGEEWEIEAAGYLSREDYLTERALQMEYGPLFAYLYRRFGPPEEGSDPHKEIACWYLTTPDGDVVLWVSPRPSGAKYSFGYGINAGRFDDRRNADQRQTVVCALQEAIKDLLVPTNVRDVYINAIGKVPDAEVHSSVRPFKWAGVGVSHQILADCCREDDEEVKL